MKNKKTVLILTAALILVIAAAALLYRKPDSETAPDGAAETSSAVSSAEISSSEPPSSSETASSEASSGSAEQQAKIQVPDAALYNADGTSVQLSEFFGKPIVLNFWASWCGPCQGEMPVFDEICAETEGEVQFIMINSTDGTLETVDSASAFIENAGYSFPVYYDLTMEASRAYGAASLPMTFFIDADGYAVAYAASAINADILRQGIDMIS